MVVERKGITKRRLPKILIITFYCIVVFLLLLATTTTTTTVTAFILTNHQRQHSRTSRTSSPSSLPTTTSTMEEKEKEDSQQRLLRRSKRVRDSLLRRSSSLGEESGTEYFEQQDDDKSKKRTTTKNEQKSKPKQPPRFRVGLLADIQYAPIPDGYSYSGVPRYYQNALRVARIAASKFESSKSESESSNDDDDEQPSPPVDLVVNLGDIVDGKCQAVSEHGGDPIPDDDGVDYNPGSKAVDDVMEALSVYKRGKILHAYGNHCLYNLDRTALQQKLGIPFVKEPCGDLVGYSSYSHQGFHFITIDSYDIAKMQRCEITSQKRKHAEDILRKNNPNYHENENSPEGLVGIARRFVAFNGAVGPVQMEWLRSKLDNVRKLKEKAVILSHQPILPKSTNPITLIWNYHEVLALIREFGDCVVACFSGHAHKGGYKRDGPSGIHFRVFEAVLENVDPTYAIIDFYDDRLEIKGFGECRSATYDFEHLLPAFAETAEAEEVTMK